MRPPLVDTQLALKENPFHLSMYGTTSMSEVKYRHIIEYDEKERKVILSRLMDSGKSHLYTEIALDDIDPLRRTLEGLGRMLGEAIVLDTPQLRDEVVK
jgi:hypothetical protein